MVNREAYLRECVELDELQIDAEYRRMSADIAYWTGQYAEAHRSYLRAKFEHDRVSAKLHLEFKAASTLTDKGKGKTVADLEAEVTTHPDFCNSAVALIDAEVERQRLHGIVDAVKAKKDMLQSIGAKLRIEMQGDARLSQDLAERRRYGV